MNLKNNPENADGLDRVLQEWTADAPLPARFQEGVWQRIEKLEAKPETAALPWLQRFLAAVTARPKLAYAYLSALLITGIATGSVAAQIRTTRLDSELSMRYVQSIDPYRADAARR